MIVLKVHCTVAEIIISDDRSPCLFSGASDGGTETVALGQWHSGGDAWTVALRRWRSEGGVRTAALERWRSNGGARTVALCGGGCGATIRGATEET